MRELLLARHAKSDWSAGVEDHERPLNARGTRDAAALGEWLRDDAGPIDRVIVSSAVRTRTTWELASAAGGLEWPVEYRDEIYEADWREVLDVVRSLDDETRVLVVGHNPGLEDLASALAATWSAPREALEEKFPTSAVARLVFDSRWDEVGPGCAQLTEFVVARG